MGTSRENNEDEAMLCDIDDADDDASDVDEEERAEDAADMEMVAAVVDDDELDDIGGLMLTREDVNLGRFSVHKVCGTLLSSSMNAHAITRSRRFPRASSTTPPSAKS